MEILRELVPGLKRVLLPYDATNAYAVAQLAAYRDAARRLGLTLVERPVSTEEEARAVIARIRKGEVDGIFSPPVPLAEYSWFHLRHRAEAGTADDVSRSAFRGARRIGGLFCNGQPARPPGRTC